MFEEAPIHRWSFLHLGFLNLTHIYELQSFPMTFAEASLILFSWYISREVCILLYKSNSLCLKVLLLYSFLSDRPERSLSDSLTTLSPSSRPISTHNSGCLLNCSVSKWDKYNIFLHHWLHALFIFNHED